VAAYINCINQAAELVQVSLVIEEVAFGY